MNETTNQDINETNDELVTLDDDALQSISGGCYLTTISTSCVPPGVQCP